MRKVEIPDIDYETFAKITNIIFKHDPDALVEQRYTLNSRIGIYIFQDSDHIPSSLINFKLTPSSLREKREKIQEELGATELDIKLREITKKRNRAKETGK